MKRNFLIWNGILSLVVGFNACRTAVAPYQNPMLHTDSLYRNGYANTDSENMATIPWRQFFTDTILRQLIATGIGNNLDLKIAYSRLHQAQAYWDQSRLAFYPDLNANASADIAKTSSTNTGQRSNVHQYQLGLNSAWEADIWGKLKSAKEANLASLLATEANASAIQTNIVASIANQYFQLMAYDWQLEIAQQTFANWQQTVTVMKALKKSDYVTGAAVVQSEASMYAVQTSIPDLKRNIRETENAICFLMGVPSQPIQRDSLRRVNSWHPQLGIPAQLLANRPDVQQAEMDFRNAFALTNVARTQFYPSLTITANGGFSNNKIGNLFSANSLIGGILGGLTQPIFNKGLNKTNLKVAQEQQQQALFHFQNILLAAGQEVSNALFAYQTAMDKHDPRDSQLVSLGKSVNYTLQLVRNGFPNSNYSEVLIAMQSLLAAQLSQVGDYLQKNQAIINLYAALGGGWK